jgi:antitoxin component YwqK of YwqJK toxin-antitoxin module
MEEATFKNGQLNGLYKKYATYNGKREIAKSETYKDGVLDGPATYYGENGVVLKQGNYKNDKKDGKWIMLDPYTNYNYNYKNQEVLKGAQFIKSEPTYVNGEPVMNGKYTTYYYPSGKVRAELEYTNGVETGEQKWYYPDGTQEAYYKFDGLTKKYLVKKSFYPNGKVMENSRMENGEWIYEGYEEDGSPNKQMQYAKYEREQEEKAKKKKIEDDASDAINIAKGDSAFKKHDYYGSLQFYRALADEESLRYKRNAGTVERLARLQDYANSNNMAEFETQLNRLNEDLPYITDESFKSLMTEHIEALKKKIGYK